MYNNTERTGVTPELPLFVLFIYLFHSVVHEVIKNTSLLASNVTVGNEKIRGS